MVASPVFEKMFNGSFKESSTDEVPLPDKKLEEIQWMLDYIYPEVIFDLTGKCKSYFKIFL